MALFARFTALRALPEGAGREGRARRRHPLQARARVHRPAQHRRRRGDPEGLVLQRLPGPRRRHPDGRGERRQGRVRRRGDGARHLDARWATGPSSGTPPRCTPGRPCPTVSAGTAPRRSRPTSTTSGSPRWTSAPGDGSSSRPCSWRTCSCWVRRWRSSSRCSRSRRSRSSPRCWTRDRPRFASSYFYDDALVISAVLFFGARARRPRVRGNRSARAEPLHHAGQGLPAVRIPLLGPPRDRPHDQQQVLHASLR